jgi:purine-binding chemotaxis protein CheW
MPKTMSTQPYLIFNLNALTYGIEALQVKEIFPIPEITPIPEAPTDVMGVLDLRGNILPVIHLGLRLGHAATDCHLSNQVIVVDWQGLQIGMVVHQVHELQSIDNETVQTQLEYGRISQANPAFIAGVAKTEDEMVVLLNLETLIRQPEAVMGLIWDAGTPEHPSDFFADLGLNTLNLGGSIEQPSLAEESIPIAKGLADFYQLHCPEATLAERAIFRQRTESLRQPLVNLTESTGLTALAVVNWGKEYFGIDLGAIQEFTRIRNLTPIPCCPPHILGNMNLRGEIVTLVDIRSVLNLPMTAVVIGSQTAVVKVEDIVVGLSVDDVLDVIYVNPVEIKPIPIGLPAEGQDYLRGTTSYANRVLSVLDLPRLLSGDQLVVDQSV